MISAERGQKQGAIAKGVAEFGRVVEPVNDDRSDLRDAEVAGLREGTSEAASSRQQESVVQKSLRPVALTVRDRELFVHLAIARYLSTEQISQLVFPERSDSIARRRLSRLVGGKHQYVRRLPIRTKDGGNATILALRPLGYLAANNLFSAIPALPAHDPGRDFLEHDVLQNQLYVALAGEAKRKSLPSIAGLSGAAAQSQSPSARQGGSQCDQDQDRPLHALRRNAGSGGCEDHLLCADVSRQVAG